MKANHSERELPSVINDVDLQVINLALLEDLGCPYSDVTTNVLFSTMEGTFKAYIISKHHEAIIICGLPMIKVLLNNFDNRLQMTSNYQDGDTLEPGEVLLELSGPAASLLMIERTLLNFIQRLCAIATLTAKFVQAISHTETKILDTRKTTPGLRHLEKYAVKCGGGMNHRMGLYDAIMIKDTHIDLLGGIKNVMKEMSAINTLSVPIIIEVRDLYELNFILDHDYHNIQRILLDNMSPQLLKKCVQLCQDKIHTEASGNININNIVAVAETGVDFASIGKLTHSAGVVDLSMKCEIFATPTMISRKV